jgi:hypothetical protein
VAHGISSTVGSAFDGNNLALPDLRFVWVTGIGL